MRVTSIMLLPGLILLALFSPPAQAARGYGRVGDPNYPGTCHIAKGIRVKSGVTWYGPGCMSTTCSGTGTDMTVSFYTCGSVGTVPPCYLSSDESRMHPECCPKLTCPKLYH